MRLLSPTTARRRLALFAALVAAVILLPVAWYLGSPLFINQTVDEAFPVEARAAGEPVSSAAAVVTPTATLVPPTATPAPPTVTPVPATAVRILTAAPATAAQPVAANPAAATPPAPVRPAATAILIPPASTPPPAPEPTATPGPPTATPAAAGPVAWRRGQFTRIDAVHWAEGTATIYQLPDGQRLLRLEPFKAGNGPGLYVYLSGHATPRSSAQLHAAGAVELAPLKGNIGNQNYLLPPDLDLAAFQSVVIYCKPFSVVFSTASLA